VGVEVWVRLFLRAPDGGGWSASLQGPFAGGNESSVGRFGVDTNLLCFLQLNHK